MDCDAVLAADSKTLCDMGIATKGDMLALRAFCEKEKGKETVTVEREKKKAELASLLKGNRYSTTTAGSRNVKKRKAGEPKKVERMRRIEIGWLHRNSFEDKFVIVRSKSGGGTRTVEMLGSSGNMDVISYAKKLFFPNGKSSLCGEDDVIFHLGNFSHEEIGPTLVFPDNSKHPFTIENYQLSTKLTKIRLYLMTTFISSDNDEEVMVLSLFLALGVGIRR